MTLTEKLEAIQAILDQPVTEPGPAPVVDPPPVVVFPPVLNTDLDPRFYTPMSEAERAAFAASHDVTTFPTPYPGLWDEEQMARARFGWRDTDSGVAPVTLAAAFIENKRIANMGQAEYMASGYRDKEPDLACYLNLTGRPEARNGEATLVGWLKRNAAPVKGGPSGGPDA